MPPDESMKRLVLLNPGPVMVSERVRKALTYPDMCHRESEFSQVLTRVRQKLVQVCGGDESYTAVIFTGSGTASLDATISSAIKPGERVLILSNGAYGERLDKIATTYRLGE